jgi:hypothetical protein
MAKGRAKTSYFSTRITQRTRRLLEAEARRHEESLAVVAEYVLQRGLEQRRDRRTRKDKSLKALVYLIAELAMIVPGRHADDPKYNWRTNPFMFNAFRAAVNGLLASLQPPGKIVAPSPRETPERRGLSAVAILLQHMNLADLKDRMVADGIFTSLDEVLDTTNTSKKFGRDAAEVALDEHYAFSNAFQDLGLKFPTSTRR